MKFLVVKVMLWGFACQWGFLSVTSCENLLPKYTNTTSMKGYPNLDLW